MAITKKTHTRKIVTEKEVEETIYTRTCDCCGEVIYSSTYFPYEYEDVWGKYYINIPEEKEDEIKAFCCKECFLKYIKKLIGEE